MTRASRDTRHADHQSEGARFDGGTFHADSKQGAEVSTGPGKSGRNAAECGASSSAGLVTAVGDISRRGRSSPQSPPPPLHVAGQGWAWHTSPDPVEITRLDRIGDAVLRRLPAVSLWILAAIGIWTIEGWIVGLAVGK